MKSQFGDDAAVDPGKSGQFDVLVDGKLIFSKAETGRFPVDGEVEERFAALKDGRELPPIEVSKGGFVSRILDKMRN